MLDELVEGCQGWVQPWETVVAMLLEALPTQGNLAGRAGIVATAEWAAAVSEAGAVALEVVGRRRVDSSTGLSVLVQRDAHLLSVRYSYRRMTWTWRQNR